MSGDGGEKMPTFNLCETHGKCLDEDWRDDKGKSHAGCVGPPSPEVLARFREMRDRSTRATPSTDPEANR